MMHSPSHPESFLSSPEELPDWVNWLAQDADGTWWGYEAEPLQRDHGWYENEVGRNVRIGKETPNPRWADSLTQVIRTAPNPS